MNSNDSELYENQFYMLPINSQQEIINNQNINTNNLNSDHIKTNISYTAMKSPVQDIYPTLPESTNIQQQNNQNIPIQTISRANTYSYNPKVYPVNTNYNPIKFKKSGLFGTKSSKIGLALCIVFFIIAIIVIAVVVAVIVINSKNNSKTVTSTKPTVQTTIFSLNENLTSQCGKQFYNPNVKIVGGIEAVAHSWPSMAYIVFRYKFNVGSGTISKTYTCGGTLVDSKTVLTAAHCYIDKVYYTYGVASYVKDVTPNQYYPTIESMYSVYLGLHSTLGVYDSSFSISPGIRMDITKYKIHENYDSSTNFNDIAIISLKNETIFNNYIQPACLPFYPNYPISTNLPAWISGWGRTSYTGSSPNNLYNVKITLYDSNRCSDVSGDKNWNTQICAGEYSGGKDTCQGDSGGPLFISDFINGVQKYILVGITSYGDGCGDYGLPGIYTKVSAFLDWIKSNA